MTELDPEAAETGPHLPGQMYRLTGPFYAWHVFHDCQTLKASSRRIENLGQPAPEVIRVDSPGAIAAIWADVLGVCRRCRRRWVRGEPRHRPTNPTP